MNLSRAFLGLAMLAVLCACGGSSPATTITPSPTVAPCQANADSVTPDIRPLVEVSPTSAATPSSVTRQVRMACYTTLSVTQDGAATARFGTVAACKLTQGDGSAGLLVSRYPPTVLFSLNLGKVWCRDDTPQQQDIAVCGKGMVILTGSNSWISTCASNHAFKVQVLSGTVQVRTPAGTKPVPVPPDQQLAFDPLTGVSLSAFTPTVSDIDTFDALAR